MPDASMDDTLNALVAAGFGAAGQRCMALSTAIFVGGSVAWYCDFVYLKTCLAFFLMLNQLYYKACLKLMVPFW